MTHISFYILAADYPAGIDGFACRLAAKAYTRGSSIYMLAADAPMTERLDQQLWETAEDSFLPHERWTGETGQANQLLLGCVEPPVSHHEVLINLGTEVPLYFSRFERLVEIIDAAAPEAGRERYQFYRERGYPLQTHNIGLSE